MSLVADGYVSQTSSLFLEEAGLDSEHTHAWTDWNWQKSQATTPSALLAFTLKLLRLVPMNLCTSRPGLVTWEYSGNV